MESISKFKRYYCVGVIFEVRINTACCHDQKILDPSISYVEGGHSRALVNHNPTIEFQK